MILVIHQASFALSITHAIAHSLGLSHTDPHYYKKQREKRRGIRDNQEEDYQVSDPQDHAQIYNLRTREERCVKTRDYVTEAPQLLEHYTTTELIRTPGAFLVFS